MSKQDRQGVRTPADLERKYNFGKTFAEILGLANDAKDSADNANKKFDGLDQEAIFNLLTNNGKAEGIYRDADGNVYINASYILSGFLSASYITLRGLLEIWTNMGGSSYRGGYLGYWPGSVSGVVTDGVAIMNSTQDCYLFASDQGARGQAGDYDIHITKDGNAAINCENLKINGIEVVFTDNGDGTFSISGK